MIMGKPAAHPEEEPATARERLRSAPYLERTAPTPQPWAPT